PATPCVTGMYSNQLNYHTIFMSCSHFLIASAKVALFSIPTNLFAVFLIKKAVFLHLDQNKTCFIAILSYKLPRKKIFPIL
ncbi:MAG: hypothetical protein UE068_07425, partial [Paludibacteraceae bacterium]|nr:hypothetical protein [Paludibacteraceae bacterium]